MLDEIGTHKAPPGTIVAPAGLPKRSGAATCARLLSPVNFRIFLDLFTNKQIFPNFANIFLNFSVFLS